MNWVWKLNWENNVYEIWNPHLEKKNRKLHTVVCILVRMKSFSRFWKKHPLCRIKWYLIWNPSWFSLGKNKTKILKNPITKYQKPKEMSFFSSSNSQYFFSKISGIGLWVSMINWWEGHFNVSFNLYDHQAVCTVKNHIHELQGFWSMLWRFVSLGIAGYIKVGVSYT